jgi:hypothetical protein
VGCHGERLSGGRIPGAPSSLPVPANLTPHASGLGGWSQETFVSVLDTGVRPDGLNIKQIKGKPAVIIVLTLLGTIILGITTVFFVTITALISKPYPNLQRLHSETYTLGSFESDSGHPQWTIIYYSEDTTFDSYEVVYDWYKRFGHYDSTGSSGNYGSIGRQSDYHHIPVIGLVKMGDSAIISECSVTKTTCVTNYKWFSLIFTGSSGRK